MAESGYGFRKLDGLRDRKNMITDVDIKGIMAHTFEEILSILLSHSGPYGRFAMIHDERTPDQPPKFTKDGINILRSLEYFNPMQQIVRDEIANIGQALEKKAGDGTTSAMCICCAGLLELLESEFVKGSQNNTDYKGLEQTSFYEFRKEFENFRKWFTNEFADYQLSYKDLMNGKISNTDAIWLVSFWQAMCSTHGDKELSKTTADIFSQLPEEAWPNITFIREEIETEDRIKLEKCEDQFSLSARPFVTNVLNKSAGTEFEQSSCNLIILNSTLTSEDPVSTEAMRLIQECNANQIPVVLICPGGIDQFLSSQLEKSLCPDTAVFTTSVREPKFNEITALQAVTGINRSDSASDVKMLYNCHVKYENNTLILNNIYSSVEEDGETGTVLEHPDVHEKSSKLYRALDELSETIEKLSKADNNRHNLEEIRRLRMLYNKMKYCKSYNIRIGGSVRDNACTIDVITDALLAVKSSLVNGFVPAGNLTMMKICSIDIQGKSAMFKSFKEILYRSCEEFLQSLISQEKINEQLSLCSLEETHYHIKLPEEIRDMESDIRNVFSSFQMLNIVKDGLQKFVDNVPLNYVSIQPAEIEPEILRKFEDVILKYLYTNRVLAPGGIYEDNDPVDAKFNP